MNPIIALLIGVILALSLTGLARLYPPGKERLVYGVGLVVAALVYVVFAVSGRASAQWLAIECIGVVIYGCAVWGGLRGRPMLLAMGWAVHVAWDVLLHLSGSGADYTPDWYPLTCAAFDPIVAGAVLASTRRIAPDVSPLNNNTDLGVS